MEKGGGGRQRGGEEALESWMLRTGFKDTALPSLSAVLATMSPRGRAKKVSEDVGISDRS